MRSRQIAIVIGFGCLLGLLSFGCMSYPRPSGMQARGKAQPSAVPDPTPVPQPAWEPAKLPTAVAPAQPQPASGPAVTPASATVPITPTQADAGGKVPPAPVDSRARVRDLHQQAATAYAGIDSYIARLRRRETVNGAAKPEEVLLFKFRKQPFSVYFKWLGDEGKGREVVFVKGQHDSKLHTLMAAGDMPFAPAGKRIALDPDSVLVRSRSRHPITSAGIGHLIEQFGRLVDAEAKGVKGVSLTYLGSVKRPEYDAPLEGVQQSIDPTLEPDVPGGGSRLWFFDPANHLPVLLVTRDAKGHEVEYYCYDRLQYPVRLDEDDFNPDKLWKR